MNNLLTSFFDGLFYKPTPFFVIPISSFEVSPTAIHCSNSYDYYRCSSPYGQPLNMTTANTIFVRKSVNYRGIPFEKIDWVSNRLKTLGDVNNYF